VTPPAPSFDELLAQLRRCDEAAAAAVFQRFRYRLIGLARQRLDARLRRKVDPEDVVQSVFRTVFHRLAAGQFELGGWDGLWSLLTCVTVRKCGRWREHFRTQARDIQREMTPSLAAEESPAGLEVLDREPAPEEVAMLAETVQQVLGGLDEREQQVVTLSLQGYAAAEVCREVGCTESKVYRALRLVRRRLERERDAGRDDPDRSDSCPGPWARNGQRGRESCPPIRTPARRVCRPPGPARSAGWRPSRRPGSAASARPWRTSCP
jgi:RNA polymerase sigma-70 factor (ECF subfamily)